MLDITATQAFGIIAFAVAFTVTILALITAFALYCAKADLGIFFGYVKEGTGAIIVRGESFERVVLSFAGHTCKQLAFPIKDDEGNIIRDDWRWTIAPGKTEHASGFLGFLERQWGIYYFGLWPLKQRLSYDFRWSEWANNEDGTRKLRVRDKPTVFFYAGTFGYGLIVKDAETGGRTITVDKDGRVVSVAQGGQTTTLDTGGNLSVDVELSIQIRIIHPEIALMRNEDWFEQLEAVLIDHVRLWVGSRAYDDLRASVSPSSETRHPFAEYVMKLNQHAPIGEDSDSIVSALGVQIFGASILDVRLTTTSQKARDATTAKYVAVREREAAQEKADGEAYTIREKGKAEAEAERNMADAKAYGQRESGKAEAEAIGTRMKVIAEHGDMGLYILQQDTLAKVGEKGNLVLSGNGSNDPIAAAAVQARLTGKEIAKATTGSATTGATPAS